MRLISRVSAAVMLFAAPMAPLAAQQAGNIRGVVTKMETRGPVSGARVSVLVPARVAITDPTGAYTLRDLPAGTYRVFVTAIGQAPDSAIVTVRSGATATHDFAMREGSLLLSTMIVSATRTPMQASQVASTVNVLTPEQVRQSPAQNAQDLLREVPAVELPRTSSSVGGTAQIVSIRGVDEGRTAVLFDGIPVNDAWGEWIDWGRVPKSMLDRVEVVEGGTSSLYGNGAMGGLISFFSRPMAPGSMNLQLDGGSRDARHAYIAAGVPLVGALTATANGDYQEKGGYRMVTQGAGPGDIESNVVSRNAFLRLNYAPSANWSAFATGHLFGDSRVLGTALSRANRDQRNIDLGFDHKSLAGGALGLRAWDGRQIENQRSATFRSQALRAEEDSSVVAQIPSHDWGASVQWTRSNSWHLQSFAVGADFRHYQGDYNEADFVTSGCPTSPACHSLSQHVSSGGNQSLSGAFVQAIAAPTPKLRVELSGRVDQWNNDNGHSLTTNAAGVGSKATYPDKTAGAFSPRVGARYQLHTTFAVHGAVYKAFRAPNLAELYRKQVSSTQITIPNPSLESENAVGREIGFDWQPLDWLQTKGTWYVADYNNFNVPTDLAPAGDPARPAECGTVGRCRMRLNVTRTRSEGGEAYVALRPVSQLFLSAAVNYDDARQQSNLPPGTTNDTKPHINRVPSPKQTVRGTWSSPRFGDWTAIWRHEGKTTTLRGATLDPFTVVDANVQREIIPGLRGFLSIENIGDTKYQVDVSGSNTAASPLVVTTGLPRTLRIGVEAYKY
jgi:outer membrane receptor protein involved in Fe transport